MRLVRSFPCFFFIQPNHTFALASFATPTPTPVPAPPVAPPSSPSTTSSSTLSTPSLSPTHSPPLSYHPHPHSSQNTALAQTTLSRLRKLSFKNYAAPALPVVSPDTSPVDDKSIHVEGWEFEMVDVGGHPATPAMAIPAPAPLSRNRNRNRNRNHHRTTPPGLSATDAGAGIHWPWGVASFVKSSEQEAADKSGEGVDTLQTQLTSSTPTNDASQIASVLSPSSLTPTSTSPPTPTPTHPHPCPSSLRLRLPQRHAPKHSSPLASPRNSPPASPTLAPLPSSTTAQFRIPSSASPSPLPSPLNAPSLSPSPTSLPPHSPSPSTALNPSPRLQSRSQSPSSSPRGSPYSSVESIPEEPVAVPGTTAIARGSRKPKRVFSPETDIVISPPPPAVLDTTKVVYSDGRTDGGEKAQVEEVLPSLSSSSSPSSSPSPSPSPSPPPAPSSSSLETDSVYQAFVRKWCFASGPSPSPGPSPPSEAGIGIEIGAGGGLPSRNRATPRLGASPSSSEGDLFAYHHRVGGRRARPVVGV